MLNFGRPSQRISNMLKESSWFFFVHNGILRYKAFVYERSSTQFESEIFLFVHTKMLSKYQTKQSALVLLLRKPKSNA